MLSSLISCTQRIKISLLLSVLPFVFKTSTVTMAARWSSESVVAEHRELQVLSGKERSRRISMRKVHTGNQWADIGQERAMRSHHPLQRLYFPIYNGTEYQTHFKCRKLLSAQL